MVIYIVRNARNNLCVYYTALIVFSIQCIHIQYVIIRVRSTIVFFYACCTRVNIYIPT